MPSSPSALNLSQHQGLFQWVGCSRQVTEILDTYPSPNQSSGQELGLCLLVDASSRYHLQITSHMNHELAAQKEIPKVTSRCFQWKHRAMDRCWRTKKEPKSVSVGCIEADTRAQRGEEWGNWRQHSLILSLVQGYLRKSRVLCAKSLSPVQLFLTLWTVAHLAPLSMGFSRQDHWSGLPCPPPGLLT